MSKRKLIFAAIVLAGGIAWYGFRPERLFVNKTLSESLPTAPSAAAPQLISLESGNFHKGAHKTSGMATIYQLDDGKRILRLTDFATSNGPDVHVYLVAASDVTESATVKKAGFVDLGSIKGNVGDQNYEVPVDADLGKYQAVSIWCVRFGVNFGTAPLTVKTRSLNQTDNRSRS
jgi:hypothetical protein